jgi:hypothetical protein
MAQLVYKVASPDACSRGATSAPRSERRDCYVAGPLVAVYSSTDSMDVIRQVSRGSLVFPPYAVVHDRLHAGSRSPKPGGLFGVGRRAWSGGARALLHVAE